MNDIEQTTPHQHIITLTARNVKRLKAVRITPDGNPVTVIGGRNAQGKSSVLDAIVYTLAGKRSEPKNVIRNGESGASVVIDTEDFTISKRWTALGGAVTITTRDGGKVSKPQDALDALIGRVCLDPLEFARMKPAEQSETLRKLTGLDTSAIEAERKRLYEERTIANREADRLRISADQAQLTRQIAPKEPIDVQPIMERLQGVNKHNDEVMAARDALARHGNLVDADEMKIQSAKREVSRLETDLARAKKNVEMLEDTLDISAKKEALALEQTQVDAMKPASSEEIMRELTSAHETNKKVEANKQALKLIAEASKAREKADMLTEKIGECDKHKADMIAAAKMPVPGLAIEEGAVTFNGISLDCASTAEQIRISCAIGLALNPTLRTLIVREGSLLDNDALKMLSEIATENDAQIIMERVGVDAHTSVIIEDGEVEGGD
jgi:predicted ATP-dependent endonuclease of OLD family